ncbi:MAG TPA: type II toxin-antitoxin system VapC family toxin [Chloroflexota bacterium]|nr:type II toxin-antitoxin system VapC family toxin [Chloroflexota bacterium]
MIVVDASVAAKWILVEANSDKADALYADCVARNEPIIAPRLLPFEIANILRQRMRRTGMLLAEAQQLMDQFQRFTITLVEPPDLYDRALSLANAHALPAAYDAHYLVLAEHYGCALWTADQRLLGLVGGTLSYVSPISGY